MSSAGGPRRSANPIGLKSGLRRPSKALRLDCYFPSPQAEVAAWVPSPGGNAASACGRDVSADLVVETSVGSLNATVVALNPKVAASSHLAEDHTIWPPAGDAYRHLLNAVSRHGHVRMQAALEAPLAAALTPVIYLPVVCLPGPAT